MLEAAEIGADLPFLKARRDYSATHPSNLEERHTTTEMEESLERVSRGYA